MMTSNVIDERHRSYFDRLQYALDKRLMLIFLDGDPNSLDNGSADAAME